MPVLARYKRIWSHLLINNLIQKYLFWIVSPKMKVFRLTRYKNRFRSASLSVEAALAFSVFFFTVYMLWQLFLFLLFQVDVCYEVTEAAMKYSHLGYTERRAEEKDVDISWLYQPLLWTALPESKRAEKIWLLCLPEEDGAICVKVGYQYAFESVFFPKISMPVQQSFRFYPYIGKTDVDSFAAEGDSGGEEGGKDIVYVTEYGTVYHESRACGYLNVVVRPVAASQVEKERNSSGRKYTLCERCDNEPALATVYISAGGERYHLVASCPGLKRTVMEKEREEVSGMPACHKCGKTEKEE